MGISPTFAPPPKPLVYDPNISATAPTWQHEQLI